MANSSNRGERQGPRPGAGLLRAAWRFVASRGFATAVLLCWIALLLVWVVPFQVYGLPTAQVRGIVLTEPFFLVVYALLLVADVACMIARLPARLREARGGGAGAFARGAAGVPVGASAETVARTLRSSGYGRQRATDRGGVAVKRGPSAIGSVVFHLGFVLLVVGIALWEGPYATFRGTATLAEGESFDGSAPKAFADVAKGSPSAVSGLRFTVDRIRPEFHRDILLFTKLEAAITDSARTTFPVRLSDPWFPDAETMVAIEDFGYAPVVRAQSAAGGAVVSVYKLRAFPAGTKDSLTVTGMAPSSYRIDVEVYGDYRDRSGKPGTATFNLTDPRLRIGVTRVASNGTEKPLFAGRVVRLGEPILLPDGTVTFESVSHYGVFRITRSPAGPVVLLALALCLVGAVSRLALPREVAEWRESEGGIELAVWRDVYGPWDAGRDRISRSMKGDDGA